MKIINFKKKIAARIVSKFKNLFICKEKFENKYLKYQKYCKVRDHCLYTGEYRGAATAYVIYSFSQWI